MMRKVAEFEKYEARQESEQKRMARTEKEKAGLEKLAKKVDAQILKLEELKSKMKDDDVR